MLSDWACPACKQEYRSGEYPDHWMGAPQRFTFECSCGAEFEIDVDFEPRFTVLKDTVKKAKLEPI